MAIAAGKVCFSKFDGRALPRDLARFNVEYLQTAEKPPLQASPLPEVATPGHKYKINLSQEQTRLEVRKLLNYLARPA